MPEESEISLHLSILAEEEKKKNSETGVVPSVTDFQRALKTGRKLVSTQVRKLVNLHLKKHEKRCPVRDTFDQRIRGTVLSAAPESWHSRRVLKELNDSLDDAAHRAEKRKEKLLRVAFRNSTVNWSKSVKDLVVVFLEEHLAEHCEEIYPKFQALTGCTGLQLHMPKSSCASVFILHGCSAFPRVASTWLTIHAWSQESQDCKSETQARDFVRTEVIEPAKRKLETEEPPKPFTNLSSTTLSPEAEEILNKGRSFVPSVSSQETFEVDAERVRNYILWRDYWANNVPKKKVSPEVEERLKTWPVKKEKSGAKAPLPKPGSPYLALASAAEKILKYNHLKRWPRPVSNVSFSGLRELKKLARQKETIFVEADKGAGMILLDRPKFLEKIYGDILNDTNTYEEVTQEKVEKVEEDFLSLLKEQKDLGDMFSEEALGVVEADPVIPRMFGLPKLHKNGNPMRPVVSCVKSVLARSGSLLDNVTKPAVSSGWQYLKDSTTTIQYLESRYQDLRKKFRADEIYVVSFDVVAFYPSVPHDLALRAFEEAREKLEISEEQFRSLKKILKFHLENAYFKFDGKFFRQKTGLPIGSSIGGPIACLALAKEEDRLLEELKASNPDLAEIFEWYRRYLDDSVLMFGATSREEANRTAERLYVLLKGMNPAFDFTSTGAVKNLVVLDISIECQEEGLRLKNYQKPTDKRTLLAASSSHPDHVKRAIPYSVALRMRRLCTEESDFRLALVDQAWALLGRGHKEEHILDGFTRAVLKPRSEALQKKTRNDTKNTVRFVTTYDPRINVEKAFKRLQKEKAVLEKTTQGTHLKDFRLQLAFRNALNLRRLLVNKEPRDETKVVEKFEGFSRCQEKCVFCKDIKDDITVKKVPAIFYEKLQQGDSRRKILSELKIPSADCSTKNLVYLCGCLTCGLFYVGETGNSLNQRCARHRQQPPDREKHLQDGPDKNWSEVRRHFASENHSKAFWVAPIAVFPEDSPDSFRKKREAFWIRKLRPVLNTKLQPRNENTHARSPSISSLSSNGSPPVSPQLRRRLGIPATTRKK